MGNVAKFELVMVLIFGIPYIYFFGYTSGVMLLLHLRNGKHLSRFQRVIT